MVKIIIHLSSQNGFENYYRSLKDRKDTVFTVNTDSTPPKCWWHQKYIIIHLIILSSELPWEKKENLGFQLYKNASHFVLHVWRLQPMILNLIRRKISKRGSFLTWNTSLGVGIRVRWESSLHTLLISTEWGLKYSYPLKEFGNLNVNRIRCHPQESFLLELEF